MQCKKEKLTGLVSHNLTVIRCCKIEFDQSLKKMSVTDYCYYFIYVIWHFSEKIINSLRFCEMFSGNISKDKQPAKYLK